MKKIFAAIVSVGLLSASTGCKKETYPEHQDLLFKKNDPNTKADIAVHYPVGEFTDDDENYIYCGGDHKFSKEEYTRGNPQDRSSTVERTECTVSIIPN